MSVAAIVPVKALDGAKQRLSAVLDQRARGELVLWLLRRVIAAVNTSGAVDELVVVSPDGAVLEVARTLGALPLAQSTGDLNGGLELGRRWALSAGAETLLVLLGDLPLLSGSDIEGMLAQGQSWNARGAVVLAPDRMGKGTNALVLRPPAGLPFAFGPNSRARHESLARQRGLDIRMYHASGLAFDLDRVSDLRELFASGVELPAALRMATALSRGSGDEPSG